jgi:hypothetical protein
VDPGGSKQGYTGAAARAPWNGRKPEDVKSEGPGEIRDLWVVIEAQAWSGVPAEEHLRRASGRDHTREWRESWTGSLLKQR